MWTGPPGGPGGGLSPKKGSYQRSLRRIRIIFCPEYQSNVTSPEGIIEDTIQTTEGSGEDE